MLRFVEAHKFRAILAIFLFTFLLRVSYSALTLSGRGLMHFWEFNGWGEIALNVAAGNGMAHSALLGYFELLQPRLTAARSPLPILLDAAVIRLFGTAAAPIYAIQALLEAATAAIIVFLGKLMARRYLYGILAALLYLAFFPAIHYSRTLGSEPLATFLTSLLVLNLIFCVRSPNAYQFLALGTLVGALTLTRPIYIIYLAPFLFTFLIVYRKAGIRFAFFIVLGFSVTIFPWALRNYVVFGRPIITTTLGGYNLYRHNEPLKRSTYLKEGQQKDRLTSIKIETLLREKGIAHGDLNELQLDILLKREAVRIILSHKARYVRLCVVRVLWLISSNGRRTYPALAIIMGSFLLIAAYGLYVYRKHYNKCEALLLGGFVGLWILAHSLLVAQLRYVVPMMPLVCFFSALGLVHVIESRFSNCRGPQRFPGVPARSFAGRYAKISPWRLL